MGDKALFAAKYSPAIRPVVGSARDLFGQVWQQMICAVAQGHLDGELILAQHLGGFVLDRAQVAVVADVFNA
jgi:hypothetical protein